LGKKIGFGAFLGSQSSLILKITIFANLKIAILGYLEAFLGGKSLNKRVLRGIQGVDFLQIYAELHIEEMLA